MGAVVALGLESFVYGRSVGVWVVWFGGFVVSAWFFLVFCVVWCVWVCCVGGGWVCV